MNRSKIVSVVAVAAIAAIMFVSNATSQVDDPKQRVAASRYSTQLVSLTENHATQKLLLITDHDKHQLHFYGFYSKALRLAYSVDLTQAGQPTIALTAPADAAARPAGDGGDVLEQMRERRVP